MRAVGKKVKLNLSHRTEKDNPYNHNMLCMLDNKIGYLIHDDVRGESHPNIGFIEEEELQSFNETPDFLTWYVRKGDYVEV